MAYQNFFAAKLNNDIGAADVVITLDTAPTATAGRMVLEARNPTQREIIKYTGLVGNQLTGVTRGQGGTTAKSHLKNALVEMNVTAEDLSDALAVPSTIVQVTDENLGDFIVSGLVWSQVSLLTGAMTLGVVYINGVRIPVAAIASNAFAASKDIYVDVDISGVINYNAVANNAASPALSANRIRVAKIVTSATAIVQCLQNGMGTAGLGITPVAPNTGIWLGFDSIGNIVYPTSPIQNLVGASVSTLVNQGMGIVPGVSAAFIADGRSNYKLEGFARMYLGAVGAPWLAILIDGVTVDTAQARNSNDATGASYYTRAVVTPTAGLHTVTLQAANAGLIESSVQPSKVTVFKV